MINKIVGAVFVFFVIAQPSLANEETRQTAICAVVEAIIANAPSDLQQFISNKIEPQYGPVEEVSNPGFTNITVVNSFQPFSTRTEHKRPKSIKRKTWQEMQEISLSIKPSVCAASPALEGIPFDREPLESRSSWFFAPENRVLLALDSPLVSADGKIIFLGSKKVVFLRIENGGSVKKVSVESNALEQYKISESGVAVRENYVERGQTLMAVPE